MIGLAREALDSITLAHAEEARLDARIADDEWRAIFSTLGRRFPPAPLRPDERERLAGSGIDWAMSVDQVARARALVQLEQHVGAERFVALCTASFRGGDSRERCALLRALPLLEARAALTPLASEACRTSVQSVFEAIACDNPFPRDHFSEPAFNQMVLKAVFIGISLARIRGLRERLSDDLRRMARDYADERRAAGRAVPSDLTYLGVLQ